MVRSGFGVSTPTIALVIVVTTRYAQELLESRRRDRSGRVGNAMMTFVLSTP
jgi:hypothetical protein